MENRIQAIETYYNGYRFRSRLEARWAVFFTSLGVEFEYEPQGFVLPGGACYLPDFKVKCFGKRGLCNDDAAFDLFIEVKGVVTQFDKERILMFSRHCPTLVVGNLPPVGHCCDSTSFKAYDDIRFNYETIDGDYFAAYPAADGNGRFYLWGDDSNYINREDLRRVENAYNAARQARFENFGRG